MFNDLVAENAIMFPPLHEGNLHIFMGQDWGSFSEPLIQNFKTVYKNFGYVIPIFSDMGTMY